MYYSKLFNCDRLPKLMLHGIIPWLSRGLLTLVSSAELVMGVCQDGEVNSYHAFCDVQCSERCLCIVQASRFLSPSVTIRLLSNAKYMVIFILTNVSFRCLLLTRNQ